MKFLFKYLILISVGAMISCDSPAAVILAKVETTDVLNINDYAALCKGRILDKGSGTIARYGIELDEGNGYKQFYRTMTSGDDFGVQFNDLTPEKSYKYRAFVDDGTIQHGTEKEFTTLKQQITDVTIDPAMISENAAIVYFSRTAPYQEWGVHYSEASATSDSPVKKENLQGDIILDGLKPNTKYDVLPYVIDNNARTVYLDKISFTTLDPSAAREATVHNMHPIEQLRFVKYNVVRKTEPYYTAYRKLIAEADQVITENKVHSAIVDFYIPGYYTDPATHNKNVAGMDHDAYAAYVTALAYRLSGDKKYGEKSLYYLKAWYTTNKSYSGSDGALALTRSACGLMIAAELITDTELWGVVERNQFNRWVVDVYQKAGNSIRTRKNNWADWGRYASILSASVTGNMAEASENIRLIKSDLFIKIAADGHMPEEVNRNADGMWYTYFSLSPMTAAVWIGYNMTGENIFEMQSSDGASIKKAVDFLLYYVQHPAEWPWHSNPTKGSPAGWPGNLVEALYGIYNNPAYNNYVAGSRPIVFKRHFTWSFPTLMPLSLKGYK